VTSLTVSGEEPGTSAGFIGPEAWDDRFRDESRGIERIPAKAGRLDRGQPHGAEGHRTRRELREQGPDGGVQSGALSSIEASFKKIADNLFRSVCSAGLDLTLFVTGDLEFKYVFESGKNADQVMSELLKLMAAQESEMGDQVMIAFCRTIENFIVLNFDSKQKLVLTIDIDLRRQS
jgi:hypothetical protein